GLSIIVALSGCADPGTNADDEKKKDDNDLKARTNLNSIKDPEEKAAAQAFKKAGANVFLDSGTVTDVGFQQGGCDDAMAANLTKTPNIQRLTLMGCSKVTDKSVPAIAALKNLKMAMLTGTGITADGAKKIQKAVGNGGMVMHPATQGSMMKMMGGPGGAKGGGGPGGGGPGGGGRPGGR
ncbi:MAG TPA: hypothetical protein DER64_02420, partial [Planctomycetaceae bacterium]|nr:hypothetical protein [Planctomycetaceae bacterium]